MSGSGRVRAWDFAVGPSLAFKMRPVYNSGIRMMWSKSDGITETETVATKRELLII